ncbi:MAG TPA: response regulator [Candidatus Hydrogenedentes bacterium]|nr:response regulator [Candidatus Hydrogenedentota bacterium]HOV73522.1 response regulator [Candidatus Hydrogenedentota bacterium]HPC16579.1 response regulator [Candidatus Hydrogenedentota bacterium]HRT18922.1 response regulator [Candidatus Hydrogenedentota bacterium]HRT64966.1 response regulator [Candidatus Hydrogenedentota bacterium]
MSKILVVDDDTDVVESVRFVLEKDGHEVFEANNRPDGMAQVAAVSPDLIILDVMMEFQDDGIAMAQDLRRQGFTKPILMLTSVGKATGLTFGKDDDVVPVDDFQEKPVLPATLRDKVRALLARSEG